MRALQALAVASLSLATVGIRTGEAEEVVAPKAGAHTINTKIQTPHEVQREEATSDKRQQQPTGQGAVSVQMGEQDGVRIEFVGQAEGTVPSPAGGPSRKVPAAAGERPSPTTLATLASPVQPGHHGGVEFELLRCDGGSFVAGEDGGLTVKGVCDHMIGKLMQSAQQVCVCVGDSLLCQSNRLVSGVRVGSTTVRIARQHDAVNNFRISACWADR